MADETSAALAAVDSATQASSAEVVETVSDAPQGETPADPPAAESADPVSEETGDAEGQPPKGKSRAQERIEDLASTNRILREQNEFLRKLAESRIGAPADAAPAPAAPEPPKPAPKPTLESCGWDAEVYERELDAWYDKKVDTGVDNALARRSEAAEQADLTEQARASAIEFRKEHKDFDLIVGNPKLQWSPTVLQVLKSAGMESAPLAFHLATNPDKLAKISRMRPDAATVALGRAMGELSSSKTTPAPAPKPAASTQAAPAKKSTNAPPPPTPVEGTTTSAEIDPVLGPKDPKEWKKWRQQQVAERRAANSRPPASKSVNY